MADSFTPMLLLVVPITR